MLPQSEVCLMDFFKTPTRYFRSEHLYHHLDHLSSDLTARRSHKTPYTFLWIAMEQKQLPALSFGWTHPSPVQSSGYQFFLCNHPTNNFCNRTNFALERKFRPLGLCWHCVKRKFEPFYLFQRKSRNPCAHHLLRRNFGSFRSNVHDKCFGSAATTSLTSTLNNFASKWGMSDGVFPLETHQQNEHHNRHQR
jgi:hypothetical protein